MLLALHQIDIFHSDITAISEVYNKDSEANGRFSRSNQNALLGEDGVDGLKTGYTQAAGFCLAATACRAVPGRNLPVRLITVVLGAESRDARDALVRERLAAGFAALDDTTADA